MTPDHGSLWDYFAQGGPGERRIVGELSRDEAVAAVHSFARRLREAGVGSGESVGLRGPNEPTWVLGLLALVQVGARPLLLPSDAPLPEVARLLAVAGAGRYLCVGDTDEYSLSGSPAAANGEPGALLLASSGSTGVPKVVERTQQSVIDEGLRYRRAGLVLAADSVLLPLPMSHAYALGWLAGIIVAGAQARPVPPRSFAAVQRHLEDGATVMVTVPGLARVLTRRRPFLAAAPFPRLRLVMAGAGYVDEQLDAQWSRTVGVGLSRNFGSSETGAVLWGPSGLPSGCVGEPMPGVVVELLDPAGKPVIGPGQGEVAVGLEDATFRRMGDIGERDAAGRVRILGRTRSGVVRRGARWVSTLEVTSVLRTAPGIADAAVMAVGPEDSDDQSLLAEYVPAGRSVAAPGRLLAYARSELAPYKVPDTFQPRYRLRRNAVGKLPAAPVYWLAAVTGPRTAQHRALTVALAELDLLGALAEGAAAADLADIAGIHVAVLTEVLHVAHAHGVLTTDARAPSPDPGAAASTDAAADARQLARRIAEVVRPPESAAATAAPWRRIRPPRPASPGIRAAVQGHLAGATPGWPVLEISVGGPRHIRPGEALDNTAHDGDESYLAADDLDARAGRWRGPIPQPGGYRACVVTDAVHGPAPADDLTWLADLLRPGGLLIVDDLFLDDLVLDDVGGAMAVEWLARGALSWWTLAELQSGLESVGATVVETISGQDDSAAILIARKD